MKTDTSLFRRVRRLANEQDLNMQRVARRMGCQTGNMCRSLLRWPRTKWSTIKAVSRALSIEPCEVIAQLNKEPQQRWVQFKMALKCDPNEAIHRLGLLELDWEELWYVSEVAEKKVRKWANHKMKEITSKEAE